MPSYSPISHTQFATAMQEIGFVPVSLANTWEYAWEWTIKCRLSDGRLSDGRFKIRILSSVDINTGMTRDRAKDAIHIMVLDTQGKRPDRPLVDYRVNRTENALSNVVKRAREAYAYVSKFPEHHCTCGSLLVVRGKPGRQFLGCTAYPDCKETRRIAQAA